MKRRKAASLIASGIIFGSSLGNMPLDKSKIIQEINLTQSKLDEVDNHSQQFTLLKQRLSKLFSLYQKAKS